MKASDIIAIGDLAARAGVSVSAIRFYEAKGLIQSFRNRGGQRRFLRSDTRRIAFILIAQQLGLSIGEIGEALAALPDGRTPTARDWQRISNGLRRRIDDRIIALTRTRDLLDGCIGCGCLSLKRCALYNPQDRAGTRGAGARYVLGDTIAAVPERTAANLEP